MTNLPNLSALPFTTQDRAKARRDHFVLPSKARKNLIVSGLACQSVAIESIVAAPWGCLWRILRYARSSWLIPQKCHNRYPRCWMRRKVLSMRASHQWPRAIFSSGIFRRVTFSRECRFESKFAATGGCYRSADSGMKGTCKPLVDQQMLGQLVDHSREAFNKSSGS